MFLWVGNFYLIDFDREKSVEHISVYYNSWIIIHKLFINENQRKKCNIYLGLTTYNARIIDDGFADVSRIWVGRKSIIFPFSYFGLAALSLVTPRNPVSTVQNGTRGRAA